MKNKMMAIGLMSGMMLGAVVLLGDETPPPSSQPAQPFSATQPTITRTNQPCMIMGEVVSIDGDSVIIHADPEYHEKMPDVTGRLAERTRLEFGNIREWRNGKIRTYQIHSFDHATRADVKPGAYVYVMLHTLDLPTYIESITIKSTPVPPPRISVPAKTPSEAVQLWRQAIADGDEQAYLRCVVFHAPSTYSETFAKWFFSAARLHKAVVDLKIETHPDLPPGAEWSLDEGLSKSIVPVLHQWPDDPFMWGIIRRTEWKIAGDVATPSETGLGRTSFGKLTAQRTGEQWVIVTSDGEERGTPEQRAKFIQNIGLITPAINAATDGVNNGTLRTVRAVNDFLMAEEEKMKAQQKK